MIHQKKNGKQIICLAQLPSQKLQEHLALAHLAQQAEIIKSEEKNNLSTNFHMENRSNCQKSAQALQTQQSNGKIERGYLDNESNQERKKVKLNVSSKNHVREVKGVCKKSNNKKVKQSQDCNIKRLKSLQCFQNLIFSKPAALHELKSINDILMPDAQCLGCIQFFYSSIPYDFQACLQRKIIVCTQIAHQKSKIIAHIHQLYLNGKEGYLFVTEAVDRDGGTQVLGFSQSYDANRFLQGLQNALRQLCYDVGQRYITIKNFQISVLPIIDGQFIKDLREETMRNQHSGNFVLRIKFNPYNKQFFQGRDQGNRRKKIAMGSHWPVQCQRPPYFHCPHLANELEFSSIRQLKFKKEVLNFPKKALIKIELNNNCWKILNKMLQVSRINFKLWQSGQEDNEKKLIRPYKWVIIQLNCSFSQIKKRVKEIYHFDDITVIKPTKYIVVNDEYFYSAQIFRQLNKKLKVQAKSDFIAFNIKNKMKLHRRIKAPTYFIFNNVQISIMGYIHLHEMNARKVQFVSRLEVLNGVGSDDQFRQNPLSSPKPQIESS